MRRRRALLLALAMAAAVTAGAVTVAALRSGSRADVPALAAGAALYEQLGCPTCHSLGGEGNPAVPLDGVGRRLSREAIRTWIVAPEQMDPSVGKPSYDEVPAEDVDAVVEYLAGR
jgi:mono/diheme cytochrome c family protein